MPPFPPRSLFLFLVVCLTRLALAEHGGAKDDTAKPETLGVAVRSVSSDDCLSFAESKKPYAATYPKAFHYQTDADKNPMCAFLVAGVNTNECLKKTTTITGVDFDVLERRLRPNRALGDNAGSSMKPRDVDAWKGVNNFSQRVSTAGFLDHKQKLRDLLLQDNTAVLDAKLTHQKVAAPLLALIEKLKKKAEEKSVFEWNGKRFSVESKRMDGDFKIRKFGKNAEPADEVPCRSGWIGAGTQGSPFADELFASHVLTLTDLETRETLTIDELTPHLIYRYGFYQGGEYRTDPKKLIQFFGVTAK